MRLENLLESTNLQARPYQMRIVKKVRKMFLGQHVNGAGSLENAAKSVMVEAPPGSGKTSMGLLSARLLQEETDCMVAWVCMRRNLLSQAANENAPQSPGNPRGKNIGVVSDYLSMFTNDIPGHLMPDNRGGRKLLLLHDEAAHDASNSAIHLHNEMRPDFVLGLSATPYRSDRVKLCFEKVVRDIGIRELISQGWLSNYDQYTIPDWRPETVADFYAMDPTRWGASIVYFHQQHMCRRFQERLTGYHGIPTDIVTGTTDREQQVVDLVEGKIACLTNCATLTEGLDFPDLKTVFVRDSGKSCTTQMAGRVFRKSDLYQIKNVVQSKHTGYPFIKAAMPVQQWLWEDDQWLTLKVNPMIQQISANARFMLANSEQNIPKYIKDRSGKKKRRNRF